MAEENDIVLVYFEENPLFFARIEEISPDIKANWYHVKLFILQLPLQSVTWILKDAYINGETFTMGGKKMRLEKVVCPEDPKTDEAVPEKPGLKNDTRAAKVISLAELKKK